MQSTNRHERRSIWTFIIAEIFSNVARVMIVTAIGKEIYDITHNPLDLGWLGLIEFAPSALLVLVTGAIADRIDRRRIIAIALAADCLGALVLAWHAASDSKSVAVPFVIVGVIGVGRAFFTPALRALPADIVSPDRLPWLMARYNVTWQAAFIVGPVLAGFLYVVGVPVPFGVSALFYGLAALTVLFITFWHESARPTIATEVKEKAGLHEALEGFRVVRSERVLLGAISLDLFAVLFGGAIALLPAIATDRLHVGAVGLGWLRAAVGIGAASTSLYLVVRPLRRHVGRILLAVVGLFGLLTVALGLTSNYVVAFVTILVASGADAVSVLIRSTLVPLVTPVDKRGRVFALESVFIGASNELGAFESGLAAQFLGTGAAVVFGGTMTLGVAVVWLVLFPQLRDQDRFPAAV